MKTVYKYILPIDTFGAGGYVNIPKRAELLSVGEQGDDIVLWALIDDAEPVDRRFIRVSGTGHPITSRWPQTQRDFIGTVQCASGIVLHVFEEGPFSG